MTNPLTFFKQVKQEASKISWPNRREVVASLIMVLIFVLIASLFFFVVDFLIASGVKTIVG